MATNPLRSRSARAAVTRVQTGVRLEKRLLKVTKALADSLDLTLGDLLEGVLLHVLEGHAPFGPATLARAAQLKKVFALDLGAADAHRLVEAPAASPSSSSAARPARTARPARAAGAAATPSARRRTS